MQYPTRLLVSAAVALAFSNAHAASVDLGEANLFSVITFGNFTGVSGDTGKLLAAGGNVSLDSWEVKYFAATPSYAGYDMIVGGNFTGVDGVVSGRSFIGGTSATTNFNIGASPSVGAGSAASPLDFGGFYTQLTGTSSTAAAAATTGTVAYAGGSTQLTGTNSAVEVFSIDGNELSQDTFLTSLGGIKDNATVILNISGTQVNLASFGFGLPDDGKQLNLLFNFYEATSLSFSNMSLDGTVLAPYAAVTGTSGHIDGTFVAQSFASAGTGNFEFHDSNFTPVDVPSAVPEPEQWAMMVAGLMVLPWMARRRRAAAVTKAPLAA